MADTSTRMLTLLSLLQSRHEWSGPALAQRLGVSTRTVRRDIDSLRDLGYPVNVSRGPGGCYKLGAGAVVPPLIFDDQQAVAIALALQTAPTTVSGLNEAAERALNTIRQVLPTRLRSHLDAMQVTSIGNPWDLAAPAVDPAVLLTVGSAVRNREVLRFDYSTPASQVDRGDELAGRGWVPPVKVEPHHLVVWQGRWYLIGWDLSDEEWRTFRLDRIAPRTPTGPRFTGRPLPTIDVATYITAQLDRGDTADHWPYHGEVLLDAPASLVAKWAPGGAIVQHVAPARCRLRLGAWSWVGLAALLGTFDADIKVIGPPELLQACDRLARRYRAAATASA
jgi:predicted DNA-binding transcriptional regulator YafY